MKSVISLFLILQQFNCLSQSNTFEFSDKKFKINASKTIYTNLYCSKFFCTCEHDSNREIVIDSFIDFIKKHPKITLEIACHMGTSVDELYALELSKRRAAWLRRELIADFKIDSNMIFAVGCSSTETLISRVELGEFNTSSERHHRDMKNERTVLTIIDCGRKIGIGVNKP